MNNEGSAAFDVLGGVLTNIGSALQGVSLALADVFAALEQGAMAAEKIVNPEVDPAAKRQEWAAIETVRIQYVRVSSRLSLELLEALRRGAWRTKAQPAAYLRVVVLRGARFRKLGAQRSQARFVSIEDATQRELQGGDIFRQRLDSGNQVWAFSSVRAVNAVLSADQEKLIAARRAGLTRERCPEHLGWSKTRVSRVWRSLSVDRLETKAH